MDHLELVKPFWLEPEFIREMKRMAWELIMAGWKARMPNDGNLPVACWTWNPPEGSEGFYRIYWTTTSAYQAMTGKTFDPMFGQDCDQPFIAVIPSPEPPL